MLLLPSRESSSRASRGGGRGFSRWSLSGGDVPQGEHEEGHVMYVHGANLLPWLLDQPPKLEAERLHVSAEALHRLRQRSSTQGKESKRRPLLRGGRRDLHSSLGRA